MTKDPYIVLGVDQNATQDQIKSAYRKKAKECHPDLHPDDPSAQQKMNDVNEAYGILSDPVKLASYKAQKQQEEYQKAYGYGSQAYPYGSQRGYQRAGYTYQQYSAEDFRKAYQQQYEEQMRRQQQYQQYYQQNQRQVYNPMGRLFKNLLLWIVISFLFRMFFGFMPFFFFFL